ncbi:hypothetical protein AVEN_248284-1 [Araneus ventricosus]|uniref:Uncharacterized protein n=1 Tax=Araneus ventricosus TaxID=182803 RepID=A0A4Y2MKQ8_ARAVE|nr:hypothetical protein AVEN_248284-1 [Araneus ventricosus]
MERKPARSVTPWLSVRDLPKEFPFPLCSISTQLHSNDADDFRVLKEVGGLPSLLCLTSLCLDVVWSKNLFISNCIESCIELRIDRSGAL